MQSPRLGTNCDINSKSKIAIVTGASGGLGWEICLQLDDTVDYFILCGSQHSAGRLQELKSKLKTKSQTYSFDGSTCDTSFLLDNSVLLKGADTILAFWVAGTLGTLVRIPEIQNINQTLQLNIGAPIFQTQALLNILDPKAKLTVINFSSLAAIQPFDCWSLYCTGKAARDAFFRCLAHESDLGSRTVRVLNYAPGPCITRMKDQILQTMPNVALKSSMEAIQWIPVKDSIKVLMQVLAKDKYLNGAHIDYFDVQS